MKVNKQFSFCIHFQGLFDGNNSTTYVGFDFISLLLFTNNEIIINAINSNKNAPIEIPTINPALFLFVVSCGSTTTVASVVLKDVELVTVEATVDVVSTVEIPVVVVSSVVPVVVAMVLVVVDIPVDSLVVVVV